MGDLLVPYMALLKLRIKPHYARRLGRDLPRILRALQGVGMETLGDLKAEHIVTWLGRLKAEGLKAMSVYYYERRLCDFLDWLHREGHLLAHPYPEGLRLKRPSYTLRPVPSSSSALELLEAMEEQGRFPNRDRAILELCYGSALRRSELGSLNVSDIRGDTLRVMGKGDKERLVPLGQAAKQWMERYLITERLRQVQRHNPLEEALFVSMNGQRLGSSGYGLILYRKRPRGSRLTLHSLRHACATHMLQNGASVRIIQKLLGHAKLTTTQIYAHVENPDLRRLLRNFHPRG